MVMVVIRISKRLNIIKASECMEGENNVVKSNFFDTLLFTILFIYLNYLNIAEKTFKIHLRSAISVLYNYLSESSL